MAKDKYPVADPYLTAYLLGYHHGLRREVKPTNLRHTAINGEVSMNRYYCGACGGYKTRVYQSDKYCRECGTRIDWGDSFEES